MTGRPRIVRTFARPDRRAVDALSDFDVATVYEASGRRGLMLPRVKPVAWGMRACGPAVTVLTAPGDNLMIHAAVELAQPGDVLVVAATGEHEDGAVGELLVTQAR
ncbi:MAG: 4-carboxy-4-hydroxy-2-oxoadipate aldolase/oxaloacetate decarboxylase, partial [Bifidobacteriaceae bacterium]|nr:4-carboxy-4-hydroxy-2-oxoadipate aldolase/oxaloacetate decarboxylase [Bifidobacteriaceae bacterium]